MSEIKFGMSSMKSATGEIEKEIFEKIQGNTNLWYVGLSKARADHVYCATSNKDGMSGRDSNFLLSDGSTDIVTGVWKSNTSCLLKDTGLDLSDKFTVSYVIAESISHNEWYEPSTYKGILEHKEDDVTTFTKPLERAVYFANKLGKRVYMAMRTNGGGQARHQDPVINQQ